jgi:hypothetical protein
LANWSDDYSLTINEQYVKSSLFSEVIDLFLAVANKSQKSS